MKSRGRNSLDREQDTNVTGTDNGSPTLLEIVSAREAIKSRWPRDVMRRRRHDGETMLRALASACQLT